MMKKLLLTIFVSLLFTVNGYAKELKLNEIIDYFNFCKILSSFGPSCSDDFNPRDYLNGLKITIKENEIHYMDKDIWEYYFTIIEKTKDETIVSFEDLAIEGNYKARDLFKFKFDEENSIWKLNSIKNVFPNNETEYTPYNE
jgi:hydroxymethylpyrimidine pyrophosphatase-like HAD family hydrolase